MGSQRFGRSGCRGRCGANTDTTLHGYECDGQPDVLGAAGAETDVVHRRTQPCLGTYAMGGQMVWAQQ
eukprot:12887940-Prorocentrum_lima.AAC.1